MGSELWFAQMERLLNEYMDEGMPFDKAYEKASNNADGALRERLADLADFERMRRKDEGIK